MGDGTVLVALFLHVLGHYTAWCMQKQQKQEFHVEWLVFAEMKSKGPQGNRNQILQSIVELMSLNYES